jgi:hypothetical protein
VNREKWRNIRHKLIATLTYSNREYNNTALKEEEEEDSNREQLIGSITIQH